MTEKKEVKTETIGYSFSITIEKEVRTATEASKTPDKKVTKASISGHTSTFEEAKTMLKEATDEVGKRIEET